MRLEDFDYKLPAELIAQTPVALRHKSRLMVLERESGSIEHKIFKDIVDYINKEDVLVINDTKVIPARLYGAKEQTGGKVEVFLLRKLKSTRIWEVLLKPGRRVKKKSRIIFNKGELIGEVLDKTIEGKGIVKFYSKGSFKKVLNSIGEAPLPPYIKTDGLSSYVKSLMKKRYQTIYAKTEGAVAAPTAGLHFTKFLLNKIKEKKIKVVTVTLHTGLGTFQPVRQQNISKHKMEEEYFEIPKKTAEIINRAKNKGGRIFAVGTTAVRTLESAVDKGGSMQATSGMSRLFIYPGYKFKVVDRLITNFHLPKSTLLMLVSAFAAGGKNSKKGIELINLAYQEAIKRRYRFFSFGDAMLII